MGVPKLDAVPGFMHEVNGKFRTTRGSERNDTE